MRDDLFFSRSTRICFFKSVNRRLICFDAGMSHRAAATPSAPLRTEGLGTAGAAGWGGEGRPTRPRLLLLPPPPVRFAPGRRGWLPRRVGLPGSGGGGTPGRAFCLASPPPSPLCGRRRRLSLGGTGLTRGRRLCTAPHPSALPAEATGPNSGSDRPCGPGTALRGVRATSEPGGARGQV